MKFFVVSDVHSFYGPMMKALNEAGYDKDNPDHCFISCGDLFDRGPDSRECLDFVLSLPEDRRILIKGNHEVLLEDAMVRGYFNPYDYRNGTMFTCIDLCTDLHNIDNQSCILDDLSKNKKLRQYLNELADYAEIPGYIFTHSWIPTDLDGFYDPNWRTEPFDECMWWNPFRCEEEGLNQTGKTIVHGHWHNAHWWHNEENIPEFGDDAKHDIAYHGTSIGLDACTVKSHKVNVLVLEVEL